MEILDLPLTGAIIVKFPSYEDSRGVFNRFFCSNELSEIIQDRTIVNINFSKTLNKGTIRGLHFQKPPKAEMKLIRCIRGTVFDVIVDLRTGSPTFLNWYGTYLSDKNSKMIIVPEGFAHGFQTLEDNAEMLYLHTEYYSNEFEAGLRYDDPALNISWPEFITEISERDLNHLKLKSDFDGVIV